MKCRNCGFEFEEGIFCPECGTKYEKIILQEDEKKYQYDSSDRGKTLAESEIIVSPNDDAAVESVNNGDSLNNNHIQSKDVSVVANTEKKTNSGIGIASFVLGIINLIWLGPLLIPAIVGIVLGGKARKDSKHNTGLAKAGFVINIIALVFWVLCYIVIGFSN